MHHAGSARTDTTAILGARQSQQVTQHPQQWHVWIVDRHRVDFAVDVQLEICLARL
jgi:hypothetical protein